MSERQQVSRDMPRVRNLGRGSLAAGGSGSSGAGQGAGQWPAPPAAPGRALGRTPLGNLARACAAGGGGRLWAHRQVRFCARAAL